MIWLILTESQVTIEDTLVPTVPDVSLPWLSLNLSAYTSTTFNLTSSLSRLFENEKLTWEVKTLEIKYRRSNYDDDRGNSTMTLKIYP